MRRRFLYFLMPRWTSFDFHDSETPRSRSTSCCVRSCAKRVERGLDQRDRIGRTEALGQNVVNAGRLADGTHRVAGDDAGTGPGRHQHDLGGAEAAFDDVRNRAFVHDGDVDHAALSLLDGLFDAGRNFVGFAVAPADACPCRRRRRPSRQS